MWISSISHNYGYGNFSRENVLAIAMNIANEINYEGEEIYTSMNDLYILAIVCKMIALHIFETLG